MRNWAVSINRTLIFLLLLLLPVQLGKHFFLDFSYLSGVPIDYLAPTLYLTDLLSLALFVLNFQYIKSLFKNIIFIVFLDLVLLNIFFSLSPYLSLYKSLKIMEMVFLFVVFKNFINTKKLDFSKFILVAFSIGAAVEFLLSILQVVYKHAIQGLFYFIGERYFSLSTPDIAKASLNGTEILRAYGSFSHPNSMAGFYILLYFFVLTSKRFSKYIFLKYTFLLLSTALLFCTFAKVPIIIFFVLNLWYVVRNPQAIPCTFCKVSRIVVLALVSAIFLFTQGDAFSLIKRDQLFHDALTIFSQKPLFGTGLGAYLVSQNQFPVKYAYLFLQPVHSILLLYLVEAGLILSAFTLFALIRYFRNNPRNQTYYYLIFVVFLTGGFDHYWLTLQQNMLLLPILFALL
jgi:O-antigen ligase